MNKTGTMMNTLHFTLLNKKHIRSQSICLGMWNTRLDSYNPAFRGYNK